MKRSGVYRLNCSNCNSVYTGQTGRNFETRIKEHVRSFRAKSTESNYANHLLESNHSFNSAIYILHTQQKSEKPILLETLEINRHAKDPTYNLVNDQLDLSSSPLLNIFSKTPPATT